MRDWKEEVRVRLTSANLAPERTAEIVEELAQHLRDRCEELQLRGHTVESAEEAVLAEINDGSLVKELSRIESRYSAPVGLGEESRGGGFLASIWQDVRYGMRVLRLNPSFTVVCVLSLALGIGANTAIFQLINAVRMRNLPVADPDSLAIVRIIDMKFRQGRATGRYPELTFPMWREIQQRQQGFSAIAAWGPASFNLTNGGQVRYARGMWVSGEFFNVLQQPPLLGRLFGASDDVPGCGGGSAVISHAFWQREFGGDKNVIGRKFTLDSHPFEVIGVTPPKFYGVEVGRSYDVAVPLCTEPLFNGENALTPMRHGWWLASIGRLKPGWTLQKATAHLQSISVPIMEATTPTVYSPDSVKKYMGYRLGAVAGGNGFSRLRKEYETPLWLLLAVSGVVLLIACANLANLMLARAGSREREIAVRLALGASRTRLIRQLLTESLLLSIGGAAAGAILATNLSSFLVQYLSTTNSRIFLDRAMDWRVLGFTAGLASLTCVLFGLAPALKASRTAPVRVMNAAGRAVTATRERLNARQALVIAQVGLSLMLLVGALLFVRTLRNLLVLDPGFQREGVLIVDIDHTRLNIPPAERIQFRDRLLEQVRAVPGVAAAAGTFIVPVSGSGWNNNVIFNGKLNDKNVNMDNVSSGYFATMGIPMVAGRDFSALDTANSPKVAIVNQEFARKILGTEDAVGKTFKIDVYKGDPQYEYQIIGVVKNTKYYELREDLDPIAYYPQSQDAKPGPGTEMMVRSQLPLSSVVPGIQRAIADVNAGVFVDFQPLEEMIRDGLLRERLLATLAGFFAVLAGVLATVGLYGVIAYMVLRRTNEIGIRMALGARPKQILMMIVREASKLLGIGFVIGIALSLIAARAAGTLLFGLQSYDPVTLVSAVVGLAIVSIAASLIPANRAARLDPMIALREQ
jgi:putative ABC transport system permease protein